MRFAWRLLGGTRADERDENRDDSRRPTHAVVELHVGPARHMIEWCLSSVSVERVAVGVPVAVLGMRALIECGGQSRLTCPGGVQDSGYSEQPYAYSPLLCFDK